MTQKNDPTIYTIGHSTRTQADLIRLLEHFGIQRLVDIRAIPYSRYNSQFNREEMMKVMPESGIPYEHCAPLGGKRPAPEVMAAAKSCSDRSRGFAEYMKSEEFKGGLEHVIALSQKERIALMCAEADPTHCHRFWVADALTVQGIPVMHIVNRDDLRPHPENLFTSMGSF